MRGVATDVRSVEVKLMAPYEIELSQSVAEALASLVEMARKHKVTSLYCVTMTMASGDVIFVVGVGDDRNRIEMLEDPLWALSVFDLIRMQRTGEESATVLVTQSGYEWASYQKKGKIARAVYRMFDSGRSTPLIITSLTTFILVVLQILQALRLL